MIASINTLPHFLHEVTMARIADRENSLMSLAYYIGRADQLYIMLDNHDMEYLENQDPELLDDYYRLTEFIGKARDIEDKRSSEAIS